MNIHIKPKFTTKPKLKIPGIGIAKDGTIVLFIRRCITTNTGYGVMLHGHDELGKMLDPEWDLEEFEPFEGEITISN